MDFRIKWFKKLSLYCIEKGKIYIRYYKQEQ